MLGVLADARQRPRQDRALDSHPQCRCTMVPRTASWDQLGFAASPAGRRSHRRRPVRPPARRDLGPTRVRLYREGALDLRDLRPRHLQPAVGPRPAAGGWANRSELQAAWCTQGGAVRPAPSALRPVVPRPERATRVPGRSWLSPVDPLSGSFRPLDGRPDKRGGPRPGPARTPRAGDGEVGAGWKRKTTGPQLKSYSTSVKLSNREPTIARANRSSLAGRRPSCGNRRPPTPARRCAPCLAVRAGAGPGGAALERVGVVAARPALPRSRTSTRSRAPAPGA